MVESIRRLLADEPIDVLMDDGSEREPWESLVFLVLVTPGAIASRNLGERIATLIQADLPAVPVVEDLSTFDFRDIPLSHSSLRVRNAVGLMPGSGQQLVDTTRGYLGLQSFARDQKVFISYRRSDAEAPANQIEQYLWSQRYTVFLDTRQVPGGEVVQEDIMKDLRDKDFVLFIDSPDASSSPWVQAELVESLRCRIPVCAVCLDADTRHVPLFEDIPRVNWEPEHPGNLQRICRMVARGIASRCALDARMIRTVRGAAKMKQLDLEPLNPRQFRLSRGNQSVIVEYENSPVSLERLHRLAQTIHAHDGHEGIFVCGDIQPLPPTLEAVAWASHMQPLKVMPVFCLYSELESCFHES